MKWIKQSIRKLFNNTIHNDDELQLSEFEARQERYNEKILKEKQKQEYLNKIHTLKKTTFTKSMVTWILIICMADIQLSYILAFFDKGQVVEGLSNQLVICILGVAFVYMVRAYFDSKAEHANLNKEAMDRIKLNLTSKVNDALASMGIQDVDTNKLLDPILNNNDDKSSKNFKININMSNNPDSSSD